MGWFDEQIRQRMQHDDDDFADAFAAMAGVIMGERIRRALEDDHVRAKNAIDAILKYYHVKPRELPGDIRDINDQLEYLLRPAGIMRRTVNLEGAWYKDAIGPFLASRADDGTPVALLPCGLSGYRFFDVSSGKWVRLTSRNAGLINTEAICFYKPLPARVLSLKDLLIYVLRCATPADFLLVAAAALAATLLGLIMPKLQQMIYGNVIESKSLELLFAVFGFYFCLSLSRIFISVTQQLVLMRLENKMSIQLQAAGMMRLLSLPPAFFREYASGDLASRMNCINSFCSMLTNSFFSTGITGIFSLVYITQMLKYGPGLVIPGLAVILGTLLVSSAATLAQYRVSRKQLAASARESGLEYALVSGVQKIRLAGAEKRAFSKWAKSYTEVAEIQYDSPPFQKLSGVITSCISLVGTIVIYYYSVQTQIPLADYFAFNSAYGMVTAACATLSGMAWTFASLGPMLEMVRPILETAPEVSENKKIVTRLSGGIELNNVSFRYVDDGPLIVDDLSLKIRPGQYVAIVGATGCGKSTLMRLMLGFETPQKGAIYYDGKDLSSLDLKSLRKNIGTVMQNGKLFLGDIYSNIVISAPQLSMAQAWEAAELAGIADDIRAMPMGMHTVISEGGGGISGGQRQRLMIARAIAARPRLLMFDEATSALDNITQKTVSDSLAALKCTRIVIAHRLSTITRCDRILVLDKGKIVEDGTYEELLAQNGLFAELVSRQLVN